MRTVLDDLLDELAQRAAQFAKWNGLSEEKQQEAGQERIQLFARWLRESFEAWERGEDEE